jgi:hypothetical protein
MAAVYGVTTGGPEIQAFLLTGNVGGFVQVSDLGEPFGVVPVLTVDGIEIA